MSVSQGTIEICCDAPPYAIVRACENLGFQSALDVRWCRMTNRPQPNSILRAIPWRWLFGRRSSEVATCTCGQPLPELESYTFLFDAEVGPTYGFGQCGRCKTIYWDQK
jgi:hypothetical protein